MLCLIVLLHFNRNFITMRSAICYFLLNIIIWLETLEAFFGLSNTDVECHERHNSLILGVQIAKLGLSFLLHVNSGVPSRWITSI